MNRTVPFFLWMLVSLVELPKLPTRLRFQKLQQNFRGKILTPVQTKYNIFPFEKLFFLLLYDILFQ